jgi:Protein of unknown function (DUF3465)
VNKLFLKLVLLAVIGFCSAFFSEFRDKFTHNLSSQSENSDLTGLDELDNAFNNQRSNLQVKQKGRILKILRDDDNTPRHQRFLVGLSSGLKLLIVHNIDLAPRVEGLKEGRDITFYGEYEWNNKGGVVHWTHRDPKAHHRNGWLYYDYRQYD